MSCDIIANLKMSTPKPVEKGWNDPPKMEYSPGTVKPKRTLLNKRVAYPLLGAAEITPPPEAGLVPDSSGGPPLLSNFQILPPASTTDTPRPVPLLLPTLDPNHPDALPCQPIQPHSANKPLHPARGDFKEAEEDYTNSDVALKSLMEKLECKSDEALLGFVLQGIENTFRLCGDELTERAQEEVSRKLDLFKECWLKNQLPDIVKIRMTHLATALHKNYYDIANEIHLTLIVDHTAVVHQWMVAVKRIIQEAMKMEENKREM